jgi:hypothetical protein
MAFMSKRKRMERKQRAEREQIKPDLTMELGNEARLLLKTQLAIATLTRKTRVQFMKDYKAIAHSSAGTLSRFVPRLRQNVKELRERFGITASDAYLRDLIIASETSPETHNGRLLLVPKWQLKEIMPKYEQLDAAFARRPEHAGHYLDVGRYRTVEGTVEVYLLECMLYEEMCALFNAMRRMYTASQSPSSKMARKTAIALCRASILHAYYFVEAYLNGIAFDYFVTHRSSIDEETRVLLSEWDSEKKRPRPLTLREKILKYVKLAKGVSHPPVQESNCAEMKFLLGRAKDVRDSIVHASPMSEHDDLSASKQQTVFSVGFSDAEGIVDNAINFVRVLEMTLRGDLKRVYWLHSRGEDGDFPEAVFD